MGLSCIIKTLIQIILYKHDIKMPELPEVETTRLGILPHVQGQCIRRVCIREPRLRWAIPADFAEQVQDCCISDVQRRGKYLLLPCRSPRQVGHILIHLGMSGSLRVLETYALPQKHEHLDVHLSNGCLLRYKDPRRFGCVLWVEGDPWQHRLLADLGPEPLSADFTGAYLHERAQHKQSAVKNLIMDSHIVVGVGNIYASESLFLAGIHPQRAAGRIALARYERLANAIQQVLQAAIVQGGTTLRDFYNGAGEPGYFQQSLNVYGRTGLACPQCQAPIRQVTLGQRSSYYCPQCQH